MASQEVIDIYLQATGGELVVARIKEVQNALSMLQAVFKKGAITTEEYGKRFRFLTEEMKRLNAPAQSVISSQKQLAMQLRKTHMQMRGLLNVLSQVQALMMQVGLNMMFAGMMIKTTLTRVARSTIDTFLKISAGMTQGSQTILAVSAAFEYLKYTVGEAIAKALEPFLPLILDIIHWIGDWVEQNQGLTAAIVLGGIALGTFLMILGQLILALSPIIGLIKLLISTNGIAGLKAAFANIIPHIKTFGGTFSGSVGGALASVALYVVGFIAILALLGETFTFVQEQGEFLSKFFGVLSSDGSKDFNNLNKSSTKSARDMGRVWLVLQRALHDGFQFVFSSLLFLIAGFKVTALTTIGFVINGLKTAVAVFLTAIEAAINAYNAVAGKMGWGRIDTSGIRSARIQLAKEALEGYVDMAKEMAALAELGKSQAQMTRDNVAETQRLLTLYDAETMNLLNMEEYHRDINGVIQERVHLLKETNKLTAEQTYGQYFGGEGPALPQGNNASVTQNIDMAITINGVDSQDVGEQTYKAGMELTEELELLASGITK